jgi:hypothetical protein
MIQRDRRARSNRTGIPKLFMMVLGKRNLIEEKGEKTIYRGFPDGKK